MNLGESGFKNVNWIKLLQDNEGLGFITIRKSHDLLNNCLCCWTRYSTMEL